MVLTSCLIYWYRACQKYVSFYDVAICCSMFIINTIANLVPYKKRTVEKSNLTAADQHAIPHFSLYSEKSGITC